MYMYILVYIYMDMYTYKYIGAPHVYLYIHRAYHVMLLLVFGTRILSDQESSRRVLAKLGATQQRRRPLARWGTGQLWSFQTFHSWLAAVCNETDKAQGALRIQDSSNYREFDPCSHSECSTGSCSLCHFDVFRVINALSVGSRSFLPTWIVPLDAEFQSKSKDVFGPFRLAFYRC